MSDYEAQRLANIEANLRMMEELGIKRDIPVPDDKPPPAKKEKRERVPAPEPSRKSRRISAAPRPDYATDAKSIRAREINPLRPSSSSSSRSSRYHAGEGRQASSASGSSRDRDSQSFSPPPAIQAQISAERQLRIMPAPAPPPTAVPNYTADRPTWEVEDGQERGYWRFEDGYEGFTPNLSPEEMMRWGSFGGTYFRSFYSSVTHQEILEDFGEFPEDWYRNPDLEEDVYLTSQDYSVTANRYDVKASQSIEDWEKAGWIRAQDPRGWAQWYFRFWLGRRTEDDARQISRWAKCVGPRGRFKTALIKQIANSGDPTGWDNFSISPIHRQTLQHWAYVLTKADFEAVAGPIQ